MPLNPLDWPAEPFLTLYFCLAAAAVLIVLVLRIVPSTTSEVPGWAITDPLELAWLTGGRGRAADTVLVAFLESGTAQQDGRRLKIDPACKSLPSGFRRFATLASAVESVAAFRRAIQPGLNEVNDALAQRGLVPSRDEQARLKTYTLVLLAIPLVLGLLKCVVGLSRDRPIGFLVLLMLVTIGIAAWLFRNPVFRTRAGGAAAANAQSVQARAARAPQENEIVLAFALTGAAVLAGRPYAPLLQPSTGSGDSGSGCSGGGGDSGGGGGCGGCSGSS